LGLQQQPVRICVDQPKKLKDPKMAPNSKKKNPKSSDCWPMAHSSVGLVGKKKKNSNKPDEVNKSTKEALNSENNNASQKQQRQQQTDAMKAPSSSLSRLRAVALAYVALGLGVCTPPLLHHWGLFAYLPLQQRQQRRQQQHSSTDDASAATTASKVNAADLKHQQNYPCTRERLQEFWHDNSVAGFHIACFETRESSSSSEGGGGLLLDLYRGGVEANFDQYRFDAPNPPWDTLRRFLAQHLDLPMAETSTRQPWALYTPAGERIVDGGEVEPPERVGWFAAAMGSKVGMVLVYEGGQFLWPGVRLGFEREIALYSIMPPGSPTYEDSWNRSVTLETLSLSPLVLSVKGFLSDDECTHIQVCVVITLAASVEMFTRLYCICVS
jgi:hypothetical protein